MKIRSQIILAQAPIGIIIIIITFLFIFALNSINYKADSILVDNFKNILSMQKLTDAVEELNSYVIDNPHVFDEQMKKIEMKVIQEIVTQEKLSQTPNEEMELTQALRKQWETYKENIHSLQKNPESEKNYKQLKRISADIISLNQDALVRKKNELSEFIINYRLFISFFAIVSLIFGFFMSWVVTELFLSPLNKMTEIVSQFGKTDETTLLHIKGSEELERLSEEFNLMTSRLEEYHQSSFGQLVEDYENLKSAFDAPPYPVIIFSFNNDIIFLNKAALNLFGILQRAKGKNPLFYIENSLRDSLLKIASQVQKTGKTYIPGKSTEPLAIFKQMKKKSFLPFAYPIKNKNNHSKSMSVLMILQDIRFQSGSEVETEQIIKAFIQNFQMLLPELQMAIHTVLQETVGPLTEKQKDLLYTAREQSEELEILHQNLRKLFRLD